MGLQDFFGPEETIGEASWHCKVEPFPGMLLFAFRAPAMEEGCSEAPGFRPCYVRIPHNNTP